MVGLTVSRRTHYSLSNVALTGPKKVKVGLPKGKVSESIIDIGIWNHFGTSRGIPERPFLTNAMRDNRSKYRDSMRTAAKLILLGQASMGAVLSKLGIMAVGDIQSEITSLNSPPNAPSTVKKKGSSNPLIDTGQLRASITWVVED